MENNLIGYFKIGNEIYTAISEEEGTGVILILMIKSFTDDPEDPDETYTAATRY